MKRFIVLWKLWFTFTPNNGFPHSSHFPHNFPNLEKSWEKIPKVKFAFSWHFSSSSSSRLSFTFPWGVFLNFLSHDFSYSVEIERNHIQGSCECDLRCFSLFWNVGKFYNKTSSFRASYELRCKFSTGKIQENKERQRGLARKKCFRKEFRGK